MKMTTQAVHKTQQLYDEGGLVWFDVYKAIGIENRPISVEVPREERQPNAVRAHLLRKGAEASAVEDAGLLAAIAAEAPVVRRAARTGWREGNRAFVSHRFVAPEAAEAGLIPPECPLIGATGQSRMRGTLEGWKNLVGVAQHSTMITMALCATFAAPLLALVGRPSFALVLFGPSRVGKSFAQTVAASALGFGREQDLPSLNATRAGLQAAALSFNDHMLPINEVGTARGPKKEVYVALRDTTYALMNGQDTLRHPSWTGAGGAASTFQVICLLSSEISPDAWAARNGETRDEGEMARLIGVPVLASGCHTIFDLPPSNLAGKALLAWEKAQFQRLRRELPNQRGVAFRDYLDALFEDLEEHAALARELVAWFEAKVAKPTMSPVARDIVAKFGVLYAGGILAVDADVLPLDRKAVFPAIRRACLAALAEMPDPAGELRADLANLKERLAGGAILDLDACTQKEKRMMHNADGFQRPRQNGNGKEYVVRAQVFAGWFGTPVRSRRILEWLADEGFLDHARDKVAKRSNEWAQKQVTWPDETRVRSISVYLPAGFANLDLHGTQRRRRSG
jgi:hypothetical protein